MTQDQKIIKNKLGLLKLARTLGSVSEACKVLGFSRDISTASRSSTKLVVRQHWPRFRARNRRRLAWIHSDQAKARKAIAVPLNAEAALIVRRQMVRRATHVFSFRGMPITQVSTKAWYAALERAGIADFRWHDLRHTWRVGTCSNARRSMPCRNWADGKARRWYGGMPILRPSILPLGRIAYALCG